MNTLVQSTTLPELRVRFIRALSIVSIGLGLAGSLAVFGLMSGLSTQIFGIATVAILLLGIVWLMLVNRGRVSVAAIGLCASLTVATLTPLPAALLIIAVTAVIAAAALLNGVGYLIVNTVVIVRLALVAVGSAQGNPNALFDLGANNLPLLVVVIVSLSSRYLITTADRTASASLRAANLLQFTAEIAQFASQTLELNFLLGQVTRQISDRFGYYHVQVFLVDTAHEYAMLVASTGVVGEQLLMRKHRLAIGSTSVIGQVTQRGVPVIARDSDPENVRFRNELLPATRAELAVPILDGGQVVGALDVQSTKNDAFDQNEIQALQTLANVLAAEIRNIRLFETQATTARENEHLYQQTQMNLEEIQRLNSELTGNAWREYVRDMGTASGITLDQGRRTTDLSWSQTLRTAAQGEAVENVTPTHSLVALPLILHGQLIGAVEIEADEEISHVKVEAMREVLAQLAASLENARLYEASQMENVQKQRLNEIATRYETVGSVEELLRVTLVELGETLGAERGAIRLGAATAETNGGSGS
ncbi:MAG: GAF domain-containing protein [Anaerolineae bacterium]|nr:GAF domain-containing protein [Anaerolineae bacterium]